MDGLAVQVGRSRSIKQTAPGCDQLQRLVVLRVSEGPAADEARWVLEVRNQIERLRSVCGQRGLHRIWIDPLVIAGNPDRLRARQAETLQRGEVRRLLGEDYISGLEQSCGDQRQRLLRARADQHSGWVGRPRTVHTRLLCEGKDVADR